MIVIAHNNGFQYLPNLISSLEGLNLETLVVDTGSTDKESIDYLKTLPHSTTAGGWSIGAYIHAIENYPRDWYLFLHDSLVVKDKEFLTKFQEKGDAVGWLSFPMAFDSPEQEAYVRYFWPNIPATACFGPIFYATREALNKIELPTPSNIDQAHGMERGLAAAFHMAGVSMQFLDEYEHNRMSADGYETFTKLRPMRP